MAIGSLRKTYGQRLGVKGERLASRYLKRRGWKIVKKNFKNPFGEVDLIAEKGDILAFIEVKTRSNDAFGLPSEAVTADRKRRYIMAAKFYFANRDIDRTVRFDIIEVYKGEINHIENAFY